MQMMAMTIKSIGRQLVSPKRTVCVEPDESTL
jgi:hypothetical protein